MGTSNQRLSPRQKMINLMYIVLMAMLALNVSSDVLDGFSQVKDGLTLTNSQVEHRNRAILNELEAITMQNPKGDEWLRQGLEIHRLTDNIYNTIEDLKLQIVKAADGQDGDLENIINREDLDAASLIMLDPSTLRGASLRMQVDSYRDYVTSFIGDSIKRKTVATMLATNPVQRKGELGQQLWEEYKFDNQPVVAAVTLLTKLQNDIRYAEGEALSNVLNSVDFGEDGSPREIRVNELNAFVVPESRLLVRGSKYHADIVLAAIDNTARPKVYVNGHLLPNGVYELVPGSTGTFTYNGYIEVPHLDGSVSRHEFTSSYTVIEPSATISNTMMNVLYAGIDNPISISVPGVSNEGLVATMSNGSLTRSGNGWVARPSKIGEEAVISVSVTIDGRTSEVGRTSFRVRKLPDPTPFVRLGGDNHYKGNGKKISKQQLLNSPGLGAAIDDGLLNISFRVTGFQMIFFDSMGNAIPENSDGASFSSRQKAQIQRLNNGKRFFISSVKAVGPDGVSRDLSPIEVIVGGGAPAPQAAGQPQAQQAATPAPQPQE